MSMLYLVGTVVGLALVVGILAWLNRGRPRRAAAVRADDTTIDDHVSTSSVDAIIASPVAWAIGFLALVAAVLGATFALLSDTVTIGAAAWDIVIGIFGALLIGFLAYNIYALARSHGHSSALSLAESIAFVAIVALVTVTATLLGA